MRPSNSEIELVLHIQWHFTTFFTSFKNNTNVIINTVLVRIYESIHIFMNVIILQHIIILYDEQPILHRFK